MILDGIIIIFLVFSIFSGYKKGLAAILISLLGFVVAVILAFMFKSSLANIVIEKTDVDVTMKQFIGESIDKTIESKTEEIDTKDNSFYTTIVNNMGVDDTVDNLSSNVVKFILESAAFIIIFLAVLTCAFILQMMFNIVFELPILSSINSIGGLGIGLLMGLFKIWVVLAIISMIIPMFGQLKTLIDSSIIAKMLYDTNIIVKLLSSGLKF